MRITFRRPLNIGCEPALETIADGLDSGELLVMTFARKRHTVRVVLTDLEAVNLGVRLVAWAKAHSCPGCNEVIEQELADDSAFADIPGNFVRTRVVELSPPTNWTPEWGGVGDC